MARNKRRRKRSNNTGGLYQRPNGTWVGQWPENGCRKSKTFGTDKLQAETELMLIKARVASGEPGVDRATVFVAGTMSNLVEIWLCQRANRNAYTDRNRWENHWKPLIGEMGPNQITVAVVKDCFVKLRAKGLSNATIRHCSNLLSSVYGDLVEDGKASLNPILQLARKTRNAFLRPEHDPKKVPFVHDPADITRIYEWLDERYPNVAIAYAIGATCGLRTSEVRALLWEKVDLTARTIVVDVQVQRTTGKKRDQLSPDGLDHVKDGEARLVPIPDSLYPMLAAHRPSSGRGLICAPLRGKSPYVAIKANRRFVGERYLNRKLREALRELQIEPALVAYAMCWYAATRHTMASQWVLHGGTLEKLQEILGHSSVAVTERYAHLMPGRFSDEDRGRVKVDLPARKSFPVTDPDLDAPDGAVIDVPERGGEFERVGDTWKPRDARRAN